MNQAGGGNIIGAMTQVDEIYTLYGTRLILYVLYVHHSYGHALCSTFVFYHFSFLAIKSLSKPGRSDIKILSD